MTTDEFIGSTPFGGWVWEWAQAQGDRPAIIFEEEQITWGDLADRVRQRMEAMEAAGAKPGDRVAWLGPNSPDFIELFLACAQLGLIFVPLNSRLAAPEHAAQLANCQPELVLGDPSFLEHLRAVDSRAMGLPPVGVSADGAPTTRDAGPGPVGPEDDLLLVYTSGTTGAAKGAVHSHAALNATMVNGIACQDLTRDDIALAFLPLFHVGGLNIQVLPTLAVGGTVVLHRSFDPELVLQEIEIHRVSVSVFVPATMTAVLAEPGFGHADLSSVRGVMTGSSVVPDELLTAFIDAGMQPGQVYGATETGPTSVVLRFDEWAHVGAAGQPAKLTECRILDGELQVRGPHLFDRYWNNDPATFNAFDDGWYRTGDRAHVDDAGMIRIEGRVDDMIVSGGENMFPAEIEDVLIEAPGVADVAVIGRADDRWGEVPVALVVPEGQAPSLQELRDFASVSLARFKLPADLTIVESLPRTALGKIQKFKLR